MIGGFSFEDEGRKYVCTVEADRATPDQPRWWFTVTGDQQRYSPIPAENKDTQASVRTRLAAYYKNRLFALSQPTIRGHFGRPGRPPAAVAAAAAAAAQSNDE